MNTFLTLEKYLTERLDHGRPTEVILCPVERIALVCKLGVELIDFKLVSETANSEESVLMLIREFYQPFGCKVSITSEITKVKGTFEISKGEMVIAIGTISFPLRKKTFCIRLLATATKEQVQHRQQS